MGNEEESWTPIAPAMAQFWALEQMAAMRQPNKRKRKFRRAVIAMIHLISPK